MQFPKWVNSPGTTPQQRASNRLKYIMGRLAVEYSREGTLIAVTQAIGMSHTTCCNYIARGSFSANTALRLEDLFGRKVVANEWLRNPLAITAKPAHGLDTLFTKKTTAARKPDAE